MLRSFGSEYLCKTTNYGKVEGKVMKEKKEWRIMEDQRAPTPFGEKVLKLDGKIIGELGAKADDFIIPGVGLPLACNGGTL